MKKVIALLLALMMVASLAACGNDNKETTGSEKESTKAAEDQTTGGDTTTTEEPTTEAPVEPKTITLYHNNAGLVSGVQTGYAADYMAEKGIILDVWAYDKEKLSAILASEQYPDILYVKGLSVVKDLSESGNFINFSEYKDQLPNVFGNEKVVLAANYADEYCTENDGIFALPCKVGTKKNAVDTGGNAIKLNWEVYKQIGAPEIKSLEDLITVLEEMQKACPTAADGTKMYAMHLCNDQDTVGLNAIKSVYGLMGVDYFQLPKFAELNNVTSSYDYILDDDSVYKYGLWFMNQLYRKGLLDPDSITTDNATQHAKIEAGKALAGWASIPAYQKDGYFPVYVDGITSSFGTEEALGNGVYVLVNKKTENLDTCLAFVDMLADPVASLILRNGPQGELWDLDESGKAVPTQKGLDYLVNGATPVLSTGEEFKIFNVTNILAAAEYVEDYGNVRISMAHWDDILNASSQSDAAKEWSDKYGYDNYLNLMRDKNAVYETLFSDGVRSMMPALGDDEKLIQAAANEEILNYSWKIIYAESDAEFEKLWDDMVKVAEGLGAKTFYENRLAEWKATEVKWAEYKK